MTKPQIIQVSINFIGGPYDGKRARFEMPGANLVPEGICDITGERYAIQDSSVLQSILAGDVEARVVPLKAKYVGKVPPLILPPGAKERPAMLNEQ